MVCRAVSLTDAPSDDRRADQAGDDAGPGACSDADAHGAHQLHGVEPEHRADQDGAHGERRGELAAGAADDVLHRVERIAEGVVGGGQRGLRPRLLLSFEI